MNFGSFSYQKKLNFLDKIWSLTTVCPSKSTFQSVDLESFFLESFKVCNLDQEKCQHFARLQTCHHPKLSFKVTFKAERVGVTDLSPAIANTLLATPTVWWYVCFVRKSRSQLSSTPLLIRVTGIFRFSSALHG